VPAHYQGDVRVRQPLFARAAPGVGGAP
jgi:hypothetical protein